MVLLRTSVTNMLQAREQSVNTKHVLALRTVIRKYHLSFGQYPSSLPIQLLWLFLNTNYKTDTRSLNN